MGSEMCIRDRVYQCVQGGLLRILRSMMAWARRLPDIRTSVEHSTRARSFVQQGRKPAGKTVLGLGSVGGRSRLRPRVTFDGLGVFPGLRGMVAARQLLHSRAMSMLQHGDAHSARA